MLDELPFETDDADKPRRHRRRSGGRTVMTLLLVVVLLGTLGIAGWFGFDKVKSFFTAEDYEGDGNGTVVQVEVPEGAYVADIGNLLYQADVVKSSQAFVDAAEANPESKNILPGTYSMEEHMSGEAAVKAMLDGGARGGAEFTVHAGLPMWRTFEALEASTGVPAKEFEAAAEDPEKLGIDDDWFTKKDDSKEIVKSVEGFLMPGDYQFTGKDSAEDMLKAMVGRFMDYVDESGFKDKVKDLDVDLSPYEALIVASLAQGEAATSKPDDFPKVVRVVYNRLFQDYTCTGELYNCLQFDSALNYGIQLAGGEYTDSGDITADQRFDESNDYNTNVYAGLTPTPISSPSETALDAAINPADGNWYFFVAVDQEGTTKFAEDQDEFDVYLNEACQNGVFDCENVDGNN